MVISSPAPSRPVRLAPNTVPSFYSGQGWIGDWRGVELPPTDPEDWIASCSRRTGMGDRGLTVLGDGVTLADAIAADPVGWRGRGAIGRGEAGMLLKLLDAGVRLPVHVHPDTDFARRHLDQPHGKAEAWFVLRAEPGATVHLGFRSAVTEADLADWVSNQDITSLLEHMNELAVSAGDVFYCPPGVPHAIGAGILVVEIQQPSDTSLMLEWQGFPIATDDRFFGLDQATALSSVDRRGYEEQLGLLRGARIDQLQTLDTVLPVAADQYFRASLVRPDREPVALTRAFHVLFILDGAGTLRTSSSSVPVTAGEVWLVPWAIAEASLEGRVTALRCEPSDENAVRKVPAGAGP